MNKEQLEAKALWKTDLQEFESRAIEIFEAFLESLPTIDLSKEDENSEYGTFISEGFTFIYPQQSSRLARRMLNRLLKVGGKYFPNEKHIEIETYLWREL
jgi:hypothetical protein